MSVRFYKRKSVLVEAIPVSEIVNAFRHNGVELLPDWVKVLFYGGDLGVTFQKDSTSDAFVRARGDISVRDDDFLVKENGLVFFRRLIDFRNNYEPVAGYTQACVCEPPNATPCITCGAGLSE